VLENGKTAQDTFRETLAELQQKVQQLAEDLASQDAHAFLVHSRFLQDKFGSHNPLVADRSPTIGQPGALPAPADAPELDLTALNRRQEKHDVKR
jgi:hypothetical protein